MALTHINSKALTRLLQSDEQVCLLDVRTLEEYLHLGHLAESLLIPIHEIPARVEELDPKVPTVVICQHGVRSAQVAYYLDELGFEDVQNFEPGMAEWTGPLEGIK